MKAEASTFSKGEINLRLVKISFLDKGLISTVETIKRAFIIFISTCLIPFFSSFIPLDTIVQ